MPGGTLVTAISLDPTDKTLASLTHVELFVSIAVMVALLLLALWIVRMGMRPLDDMTETAGAIASGRPHPPHPAHRRPQRGRPPGLGA